MRVRGTDGPRSCDLDLDAITLIHKHDLSSQVGPCSTEADPTARRVGPVGSACIALPLGQFVIAEFFQERIIRWLFCSNVERVRLRNIKSKSKKSMPVAPEIGFFSIVGSPTS